MRDVYCSEDLTICCGLHFPNPSFSVGLLQTAYAFLKLLKGDSSLLSPNGCKRVTLCRQFFKMKIKTHKIKLICWLCYNLKVCYTAFIFARFVQTHIISAGRYHFFSIKQCKKYFCWYISKIVSLWRSLFPYGLLYISLSFRNGGKKILLEQPRNR